MAQISGRNPTFQSTHQLFTQHNVYQHHQRNRLIAPASQIRSTYTSTSAAPYTKSSSTSVYAAGTTLASNNPAVVRRNARERNRVKQVNNGFLNLRQHIPTAIIADLSNGRRGIGPGANKKLSKVDTLRMAVEYIRRLQDVIGEVDSSDASSVSSFNSSIGSPSSSGGSPQHETFQNHYTEYQNENCYSVSYAGSFPIQQNQQSNQFHSPSALYNSTDSYSVSPILPSRSINHQVSLKSDNSYDEYTNTSTDDEELLDYISLWQGDM